MNPYLKTLFQNLISAEQSLEAMRDARSQPQQQFGSSDEIAAICKDSGLGEEMTLAITQKVDEIVAKGSAMQRKVRDRSYQYEAYKLAAAEVAIEEYMHIHYKFRELN